MGKSDVSGRKRFIRKVEKLPIGIQFEVKPVGINEVGVFGHISC